jgi:prophage regulatory protein
MKDAFLRLPQIIGNAKANPPIPALIPIGKTAWYAGIDSGIFPKGIKLSPRICVWRESEIQNLIQNFDDSNWMNNVLNFNKSKFNKSKV